MADRGWCACACTWSTDAGGGNSKLTCDAQAGAGSGVGREPAGYFDPGPVGFLGGQKDVGGHPLPDPLPSVRQMVLKEHFRSNLSGPAIQMSLMLYGVNLFGIPSQCRVEGCQGGSTRVLLVWGVL